MHLVGLYTYAKQDISFLKVIWMIAQFLSHVLIHTGLKMARKYVETSYLGTIIVLGMAKYSINTFLLTYLLHGVESFLRS